MRVPTDAYPLCSGKGHGMFADSLHHWIVEARDLKIDEPRSLSIDVQTLLPHRGDMLLIDSLNRISRDKTSLAATMLVDLDDPVFQGHFPGDPVNPGVLLVDRLKCCSVAAPEATGRSHARIRCWVETSRVDMAYGLKDKRVAGDCRIICRSR
jgi:hypothetical protein